MVMRKFTTSAAMLALIAGIGTGALAQTAPAADDLPAPLAQLNLNNLEVETKRDGVREVEGRTADGVGIEAKIDKAGNLMEVEAEDGVLPQSLVDALLPQAVRNNEVIGQFARLDEIENRNGRVWVKGEDADGQGMRAAFDGDGRVLRFGLEDDRRDGRGRGHDDRGPRHGDHAMRGQGHGERPMGAMRGAGRDGDARGPVTIPADFDAVAVNQKLTQAGYQNFGFLRPNGPRVMLEATNPQGEAVTLELDRQGELVRETAR